MDLKYISTYALPTKKAHGVQIAHMCAAFADVGVNVELLLPESPKTKKEKDIFRFYDVPRTFSVTRLKCSGYGTRGRLGYWVKLVSFLIAVRRYIGQGSKAVLYGREPALGFFLKGHVLELHALPAHVTSVHRFLWRRTRSIVTLTSFTKRALVEAGIPKEKILVAHDAAPAAFLEVHNLREDMRAKHGLPADKQIVAYVGKYKSPFGKGTGVDDLIKASALVRKKIPNAFLLLVGINVDSLDLVQKRCRAAGMDEADFCILSHVPHNMVIEYMQAADVLVMGYPWSEHHAYRMSPMKLFEYMASGRPIVATSFPSVREILNDTNAILVEPDRPEELAEGITRALSDREQAHRIAKQAREDVSKNTWKDRAEHITDFIHRTNRT